MAGPMAAHCRARGRIAAITVDGRGDELMIAGSRAEAKR